MSTTVPGPDVLIAVGGLAGYQITAGGLDTAVFIGAICGSVIAACVMDGSWKARFVRWACSLLAGIVFAPALIEWRSITSPGFAMATTGAVSFVAWGLLRVLQEEAPKLLRKKVQEAGK